MKNLFFLCIFVLGLTPGCATQQLKPQHADICEQRVALNKSMELSREDLQNEFPNFKETVNVNHDYIVCGKNKYKPPVILLHELPGLEDKTLNYAKSLAIDFTVYLPILRGEVYSDNSLRGAWDYIFSDEWKPKEELKGSTLITQWLRRFVSSISSTQHPNQEIGIIGMCMTGALPLALLDNPKVKHVVVAQPTLPIKLWDVITGHNNDPNWGISENEKVEAISRVKQLNGLPPAWVYGIRFERDTTASLNKYLYIKNQLGKGLIDRQIDSREYSGLEVKMCPEDKKVVLLKVKDNPHSSLIHDWVDHRKHPTDIRRQEIKSFLKGTFCTKHIETQNLCLK